MTAPRYSNHPHDEIAEALALIRALADMGECAAVSEMEPLDRATWGETMRQIRLASERAARAVDNLLPMGNKLPTTEERERRTS